MKRKTLVKLVIDIVMTGAFVILLFAFQTGLAFHEIAGIAACFLMLTHLLLNRAWMKKVARRLHNARPKVRGQFILDNLLIVGVAGMLVSGLLVSVVVIPELNLPFRSTLVTLHSWTAYISGGLIAAHILLHIPYLRRVFAQLFGLFHTQNTRRAAAAVLASFMLVGILYTRAAPLVEAYASGSTKESGTQSSTFVRDNVMDSGVSTGTADNSSSTTANNSTGNSITQDNSGQGSTVATPTVAPAQDTMTEEEYLGGLICDGCSKACSLLDPRCSIGKAQAAEALAAFRQA